MLPSVDDIKSLQKSGNKRLGAWQQQVDHILWQHNRRVNNVFDHDNKSCTIPDKILKRGDY